MAQENFPSFKRMPRAIGRWLVRIAPKVGLGLLVLFVLLAIPWTRKAEAGMAPPVCERSSPGATPTPARSASVPTTTCAA